MKRTNRQTQTHALQLAVLPVALAGALACAPAAAQEATPDAPAKTCPTTEDPNAPCPQAQTDNVVELDSIQVLGVRGSVASAIALKQGAVEITDSIVAEDVGKLPDNSVAAALQRVTGVQVGRGAGEVNTVLIRGLPDVVTTLNGRSIFTTTGRSIALADIPADLLQRVDVYKTTSAAQTEGGIAGAIDVHLRRPFDFPDDWTIAGGLRATHSEQADSNDPNGSLTLNRNWNTDAGRMGLMASFSFQSQNYQDNNTFNGTYDLRGNPLDPAQQVYMPFVIGSIYTRGERERKAANLSYQWEINDNNEVYVDGFYAAYDNANQNNFWIPLPGLANGANTDELTLRGDSNVVQTIRARDMFTLTSNQAFSNESDTAQAAIGWKWKGDNATMVNELSYTRSTADNIGFILDTGFIAPVLDVTFSNGGASDAKVSNHDGSAFDVTDASHYFLQQYYDSWSRQEGEDWSWKTDATWFVNAGPLSSFDAGVRVSLRSATNVAGDTGGRFNVSGRTVFVDEFPGLADVSPGGLLNGERPVSTDRWMIPDREYLLSNADLIRAAMGYATGRPEANPALFFDNQEDSYAAYVQANYDTQIGSVPVSGRIGLRAVRLDAELNGTQILDGVQSPVSIEKGKTELLPSLSANFSLRDDLMLRFGFGRSITRPGFAQLNPQLSLFQETDTLPARGSGGNPDLEAVEVSSADASLEWYFHEASLLSAALFYRKIDGYIQTYSGDETIEGTTYSISRPRNTGEGKLQGVELAYTQFFDQLPGWMSGLGLQLNATYIDAQTESPTGEMQDMTNVSDRAYNAILFYQRSAFSARLAYNWRSDYAISFSESGAQPSAIYVAPVDSLDFAFNYDLGKNATLLLEATNLLGKPVRNYFGDEYLYPRDVAATERTFSIGIRFRL